MDAVLRHTTSTYNTTSTYFAYVYTHIILLNQQYIRLVLIASRAFVQSSSCERRKRGEPYINAQIRLCKLYSLFAPCVGTVISYINDLNYECNLPEIAQN